MIPQVEQSARAGVAAADIATHVTHWTQRTARRRQGQDTGRPSFEAQNAVLSAQIANEKILTAQANDEVAAVRPQRRPYCSSARTPSAAERSRRREQRSRGSALAAACGFARSAARRPQGKEDGTRLVLTLGDVLFDTNQSTLKAGAYGTLDRLAAALRESSGRKVTIEGPYGQRGFGRSNLG
jgi:outer membrane protein OmpA-like peptidoglycan-associated protein